MLEKLLKLVYEDGAANMAGITGATDGSVFQASITEMLESEWDQVLAVNLKGVFNCLKSELQKLEEGGSIVNIASIAGLRGAPRCGAYVASKVYLNNARLQFAFIINTPAL